MTTAVYPGSFDPMTWGHVRLVEQAAHAFAQVVVAVGINTAKNCLFTQAERVELARKAVAHLPNVTVQPFAGLLTRFLAEQQYHVVIRGLRGGQDMDDNFLQELFAWSQMEGVGVTPFYMPPKPGEAFLSSSLLKTALREQADASAMAPLSSIHAVQTRLLGQYLLGVTGPSGAGKTHICRQFQKLGAARGLDVHHVDIDTLVHAIYTYKDEPIYAHVRQAIVAHFGPDMQDAQGHINRKALAELVFSDVAARTTLEGLVYGPLMVLLRQTLRGLTGLVLVDAPTLAEAGWLNVVNNHVLLVAADADTTTRRLQERYDIGELSIRQRQAAQGTPTTKEGLIRHTIEVDGYGALTVLDNSGAGASDTAITQAFEAVVRQVDVFERLTAD